MNNEIWKGIKDFESQYEVSNLGRVRTIPKLLLNGKVRPAIILKQQFNFKGYYRVGLHKDKKLKQCAVHRLVANAFIPNPLNKPQINHINGIKTDNRVENLEWCSNLENMQHAHKIGLFDNAYKKRKK